MPAKPIKELLPSLRKERGWSREVLSHHAYGIDNEGTSVAQITAIERGTRRASARTMLALAKALEIDPTEFSEYRLALARHVLDEEKVGLDAALKQLERSGMEPIRVSEADVRRHGHRGVKSGADRKAAGTASRARSRKSR
ncbi:MAG: helix-turn-helix transcriptional regulator [Solirubrobacterales bacterium]|nr:helix-turn-helix transcriptional regulator [Solirubrobacterales bacterium]